MKMQKKNRLGFTLTWITICQCCLYLANANEDKKPEFKLVLDKMTKEVETTTVAENNLNFRGDESVIISGELKQMVDLDDSWKIKMKILTAANADEEYTPLIDLAPKGVCEILSSYYKIYLYDSIKKNVSNAPAPTECPLLQRTYVFSDYVLDTSKFKKLLRPGYYRFIGSLVKDDVDVITYVFDGHVEEIK